MEAAGGPLGIGTDSRRHASSPREHGPAVVAACRSGARPARGEPSRLLPSCGAAPRLSRWAALAEAPERGAISFAAPPGGASRGPSSDRPCRCVAHPTRRPCVRDARTRALRTHARARDTHKQQTNLITVGTVQYSTRALVLVPRFSLQVRRRVFSTSVKYYNINS